MRRAQATTGGGLATVGLILLAASIDPGRVTDAAALVLLALGVALVVQGARMVHCATRPRRRSAGAPQTAPPRVVEDPLAAAEAGADRLECVIRYMRGAGYLPDDGTDDGGDAA